MNSRDKYTLKPSSAIPPGKHIPEISTFSTPYKENFSKASADYWREHKQGSYYNVGYNLGRIGSRETSLDKFTNKIFFAIKEILGQELKQNGHTLDFLKLKLNILNDVLKLISQDIQQKDVDIPPEELYILFHGYVNGWMELITEKINEEKLSD